MKLVNKIVIASCFTVGIASAQILEEIVVTAQKTQESQQEVPISVSTLSGSSIKELGIADTTAISQQIPSLQLNAWSPNITIFNLRGVSQNNFTDNLEAPVAVYFDDAYVASINGISGQLYDMKRIEVLRGPQGTLFGRNATGGLIHYISQGADQDEINGYFDFEYGSYNLSAFEFAVGGGDGDGFRARFAMRAETQDGYVEAKDSYLVPAVFEESLSSGQDIGGKNGTSFRINLQADADDDLLVDIWLKGSSDDVPTGGYVFENCSLAVDFSCNTDEHGRAITKPGVIDLFGSILNDDPAAPIPADVHENYAEQAGSLVRDSLTYQTKLEYNVNDEDTFTYIFNYYTLDKNYVEDGDAAPILLVNFETDLEFTQTSQEFRYRQVDDGFRWQVGYYYLNIDSLGASRTIGAPAFTGVHDDFVDFAGTAPGTDVSYENSRLAQRGGVVGSKLSYIDDFDAIQGTNFYNAVVSEVIDLKSLNNSVFWEGEFDVDDETVVTFGLRYSQDVKHIRWLVEYTDDFNTEPTYIESNYRLAGINPDIDKINYSDVAYRLVLDHKIDDETLFFVSVNKGIKGGNWTIGASPGINENTFQHDPETITSFEIGTKSDFGDEARFNFTAFNYDYADYQAFSLAGGNPFIQNTDATVSGVEIEFFWQPVESFYASIGGSFLETSVDEVLGASGIDAPITDAKLPNAPESSMNYLLRYTNFNNDQSVSIQLDGAYYGDQYLEVTNGSGTFQGAYSVSNLSLDYRNDETDVVFSLWIKNLSDEEYKVYSLDLGLLGTTTFYAPPRTFGASIRHNF